MSYKIYKFLLYNHQLIVHQGFRLFVEINSVQNFEILFFQPLADSELGFLLVAPSALSAFASVPRTP
jgi:hypothetical protein